MIESKRTANVERNTSETKIKLNLDVDGSAISNIQTGIPFFDHMLVQISKHGMLDLEIYADGDIEVDAHHTVEDVGIVFGQALAKAMEDKLNILLQKMEQGDQSSKKVENVVGNVKEILKDPEVIKKELKEELTEIK